MLVTLEEMKNYLRVDFEDDDALICALITSAQRICMDIIRTEETEVFYACENAKVAVMYTVAYMPMMVFPALTQKTEKNLTA